MIRQPYKKFKRRIRRQDRRGATAVEFAMVAPAFLFVIFVCIEFSRMSMLRNLSQNACYETARFAMTEGAKIEDGVERANLILGRLGDIDADIFINGSDGDPDDDGNIPGELTFDTVEIQVRIEIPLKDNTLILPGAIFGENKITSQMTMRAERYRGFFDSTNTGN